ncbi:cell wall hydrolase [Phosphitispora sp. TUW77]|uniref:cell wall hydrolase n=1 Tax=Phosphitispora sp. TUW77 TaxID=3152361 RepID=UPI003AB38D76
MKKIALISIIMVAIIFSACFAYAGEAACYTVKPGDTLYGIGKRFGLHYSAVMKINKLDSIIIRPGMKLNIPVEKGSFHIVKEGETLYAISRKYDVMVTEIKNRNNLSDNLIVPGMRLLLPGTAVAVSGHAQRVLSGSTSLDSDDILLLAKMIYAESRGESLKGQIAVAAVILNRLKSREFPSTIDEVIFQKTKGVYQFTPVANGKINLEPDRSSFYAAERALKGEDPTNGALFFYNPEISSDTWIKTLPVTKVIGNHVFAR